MSELPPKQIVFFDGFCGLCNGFVDFLFLVDRRKQFLFSPLQSDAAARILPPECREVGEDGEFKSIVFHADGINYLKSDAVLNVITRMGGLWLFFHLFRLIPRALRDPIYIFIATHRYKWFGKKESCRLPSAEERARFLL